MPKRGIWKTSAFEDNSTATATHLLLLHFLVCFPSSNNLPPHANQFFLIFISMVIFFVLVCLLWAEHIAWVPLPLQKVTDIRGGRRKRQMREDEGGCRNGERMRGTSLVKSRRHVTQAVNIHVPDTHTTQHK